MKIKENSTNNKSNEFSANSQKTAEPIILLDEFEKDKKSNLITTELKGVLTSNLRSRKSSDIPAMAFFRAEESNNKHSLSECQQSQCKSCEIPVIFRIKEACQFHTQCSETCRYKQNWQNPNLKKGEQVLLKGNWASSQQSHRPSFTAYRYQILNSHE